MGQLTDQRIQYRCQRTVLEMLKDRGYDIEDDAIEETFEEFEDRNLNSKNLHMIVRRPIPGRVAPVEADEDGNQPQMQEPLFVAFA